MQPLGSLSLRITLMFYNFDLSRMVWAGSTFMTMCLLMLAESRLPLDWTLTTFKVKDLSRCK